MSTKYPSTIGMFSTTGCSVVEARLNVKVQAAQRAAKNERLNSKQRSYATLSTKFPSTIGMFSVSSLAHVAPKGKAKKNTNPKASEKHQPTPKATESKHPSTTASKVGKRERLSGAQKCYATLSTAFPSSIGMFVPVSSRQSRSPRPQRLNAAQISYANLSTAFPSSISMFVPVGSGSKHRNGGRQPSNRRGQGKQQGKMKATNNKAKPSRKKGSNPAKLDNTNKKVQSQNADATTASSADRKSRSKKVRDSQREAELDKKMEQMRVKSLKEQERFEAVRKEKEKMDAINAKDKKEQKKRQQAERRERQREEQKKKEEAKKAAYEAKRMENIKSEELLQKAISKDETVGVEKYRETLASRKTNSDRRSKPRIIRKDGGDGASGDSQAKDRSKPPRKQMSYNQKKEHLRWKEERERIDRERLSRHKNKTEDGGNWTQEKDTQEYKDHDE